MKARIASSQIYFLTQFQPWNILLEILEIVSSSSLKKDEIHCTIFDLY